MVGDAHSQELNVFNFLVSIDFKFAAGIRLYIFLLKLFMKNETILSRRKKENCQSYQQTDPAYVWCLSHLHL